MRHQLTIISVEEIESVFCGCGIFFVIKEKGSPGSSPNLSRLRDNHFRAAGLETAVNVVIEHVTTVDAVNGLRIPEPGDVREQVGFDFWPVRFGDGCEVLRKECLRKKHGRDGERADEVPGVHGGH